MNRKFIFVVISLLSYCSCEISFEKKYKLVAGFIEFYNSLPNQIYTCDEGYLQNAQQSTELNSYVIEVTLKVSDHHNVDSTNYLKCTSKVVDLEVGVSVLNHHCEETTLTDKGGAIEETTLTDKGGAIEETVVTETNSGTAETPFVRKPVQLDNEVQTNTAETSGEQFIAIPREEQKVHCIGCSSHINPQAPGVSELASIGVRQLNYLEPNIQHTLNSVVEVERQVQVVNGIRYILTLIIDYNSCLTPETETCLHSNTCKITVLEKPWIKLPDGSKHRAIVSNNCTAEWQFGDEGVVIPQTPTDKRENNSINTPQTDDGSDFIKPVHNVDVQAQQHTEKTLTYDDIKVIEEQIIPNKQFDEHESESLLTVTLEPTDNSEPAKEHAVKQEVLSQFSPNSIPVTNPVKIESLSEDKKKAIDDMLNFLNFAGFDSARPEEEKTRLKRNYVKDLNAMNLVEKFQKDVEYAKYVRELAWMVVDHLNELDLEVNTRVLTDVINVEEEFENHRHFYYVQSRIIIPCDKSECEEKDFITKICNALLDGTYKNVQIINVFCHEEPKAKMLGKVNGVALDNPVLLKLIKQATIKIESESTYGKAMKVNKVIDAYTQRVSQPLLFVVKFSIIFDYMNCNKTVRSIVRSNCLILEELASQICDVTVYERHWLKKEKITYTCTEIPVGYSNTRKLGAKKNYNDSAVLDMVNKALQNLDAKSNRNNKQVIVRVNSVTSHIEAGFVTDIEFVVGYTTCTNDVKHDTSKCKLLEDEPLRTCKAKVWDIMWIEDGRQVDVSCEESHAKDNELPNKTKRGLDFAEIAPFNQDVNSAYIKNLAKEALQKYLKTSVYHRHYDLINILRATVQTVEGTLTKLEFKISPTNCLTDLEGNPSSSDCKVLDYNDVTTCSSEIWEKVWLHFKDINTSCYVDNDNTRVKLGGLKEEDPRKPFYKALAEESMQKYLESNGITNLYSVDSIDKVTTQLVAGTITEIDFKISPADKTTGDVIGCNSKIWEQPWIKKKEVTVNCTIDNQSRAKRGIPGGRSKQDPNNPIYRKLAKESMQKYLESNGITNLYSVDSIDKVTTQVVAGTLTFIEFKISPAGKTTGDVIGCSSDIWEQPWNQKKDINVNCINNKQSIAKNKKVRNSRRRRSFTKETLKGSLQDQDPTKIEYKAIAQDSLKKYLKLQKNYKLHNVVEVKKVTTKVVSGIQYNIDYVAAPKSCAYDISKCVDEKSVLHCKARVWDQPWLGKKEIKVHCSEENTKKRKEENESREKRSVSLNPSNSTADESIIQNMVQESLHKLQMSSSHRYKQKVLQINSYSTKITSGKVTTIYFDVGYTSCLKFEWAANVESCEFLEHLPRRHCVSQVWERLDNRRNIEVTCQDEKSLLEDPDVGLESAEMGMKLANEALKHIEAKYPHPRKQKVVRIISLEKQVVAGIHYRIKVEVGSTQCLALSAETNCTLDKDGTNNMFCRVNVWLRPWTDRPPNFRVTCDSQGSAADLYHHLQAEYLFRNFLTTYKPEYIDNANEMTRRFEIFKTNVRTIHELNTHEKGTATYGVTRFADLSYEEFTRKYLGLKPSLQDTNQVPMRQAVIPSLRVPDAFDWRDYDAVTEVKNQGSCGSCWAFSVTGNIEGQWKRKSGQLVSLSEQELVDCDKLDEGCNGGLPDNAYRAIEQLGGLELESDYPYEGQDDEKCSFNKTISRVQITGAVNITSNETDMVKWLVKNGPISIGINANAMQFYMGGVSHPWKMLCNPSNLDHGVLIVGYGIKDYPLFHKRLPFWTIKNSWGPEWGEQGYYRVFRGDGTCGVNQMASSAVI